MATTEVVPAGIGAGMVVREGLGGSEIQKIAETGAMALAEREKATIQAMFVVAAQRPRSIGRFETGLLKECERPGFAEQARYRKPVGRKFNESTKQWEEQFADGFSIRFAEAAMRHYGNVYCDAKIVWESDEKRIVRFTAMDLESNIPLCAEIQLAKTVERKKLKQYQEAIGERTNSKGEKVYIVAATDDELNMKQAAAWSKFIRNVLRFMPGDILDSALDQIRKTLQGQSPEAALNKLVRAFDQLGITVVDLQMYLGKALSKIEAKDVDALRGIYTAIKDSETTWGEVMADRDQHTTGSAEAAKDVAAAKIAELKSQRKTEKSAETEKPEADQDPAGKYAPPEQEHEENAGPIPAPEPEGGLFPGAKASPSPYDAPTKPSPFANAFRKGPRK